MKTVILNRQLVLNATPNSGWNLISIQSPEPYSDSINYVGWKSVLPLSFHDLVDKNIIIIGEEDFKYVFFDEALGSKVVDYIDLHRGEPFLIHCDAGMSRSVAIGAFLRDFYGYTANFFVAKEDTFKNILVYSTLARIARERLGGFIFGEVE